MEPRIPVSPSERIETLLCNMALTGFQGRRIGESFQVWQSMIEDPDCTIFLGLSGAMIPAGMQEILVSLVKNHYVDVIVSTGANIFHDICEHLEVRHYLGHHEVDDNELFSQGIDRIYDVFAYEKEFRDIDLKIAEFSIENSPFKGSSREYIKKFGEWMIDLSGHNHSLLGSCIDEGIPVFIPALCDSSIGIGLLIARKKGSDVIIDQILDIDEIVKYVENSQKTGVVYIGGGVPKNFIQQTQVISSIHGKGNEGHNYAIQFTTDAPHWGGLSGCTFEEAISWGKEHIECKKVQCFCDATIALPFVVSGLLSAGVKRKKRHNCINF